MIGGYLHTLRQVLLSPKSFFANIAEQPRNPGPFAYMAVVGVVIGIVGAFGLLFLYQSMKTELPVEGLEEQLADVIPDALNLIEGYIPMFALGIIILAPISLILSSIATSALVHFGVIKFGSTGEGEYRKSHTVYAYVWGSIGWISWIPILGLLATLYGLVLYVIGTSTVHGISIWKSILSVIIMPLLLFIAFVIVAGVTAGLGGIAGLLPIILGIKWYIADAPMVQANQGYPGQ